MGQFDDMPDPYAPVTPWSWVPPSWEQQLAGAAPVVEPLQPGIGIPQSLLASAAPQPQEIETPPMEMRPEPMIGFPTNPDDAPLPEPDAISGADPATMPPMPPDPGMQPGLGIPAHLLTDAASGQAVADRNSVAAGLDPLTGQPVDGGIEMAPDQLTEGDRRQSLNEMDGPDYAEFRAEQAEAARVAAAGSLAKAALERARDAEGDYKVFVDARTTARESRAIVEADAAKLANEEPQTWMESRNGFQKVAAFLAAIVGGLVQGRTGSARNSGMDMINTQIEQYTQEQTAIRAGKRAAINDRRAAAQTAESDAEGDYRAEAAFRASAWEHTIGQLDAEAANYDQAGTSAFRIADARREAVAKQQAGLLAYEEHTIKRMEAAGKSQLEIAKFLEKQEQDRIAAAETAKHNRAQERASQTSAGASYLTARTGARKTEAEIKALEAENAVVTSAELRRLYPNAPAEAFAIGATSLKKFEKHLGTFGKAADVGKDQSEATIKGAAARLESSGPSGSPYAVADQEGKALLQKEIDPTTGKPKVFEIKDDTQRRRATDVHKSAQNVRRISDLVQILRANDGGASAIVGSPEYQELTSLIAQTDFETFVGYGLGAPSEGDKALAAGVRGGKDATSFIYDASPGFEAYAKGIEEKANTELRSLGYTGDAIKLKRTDKAQSFERTLLQNMDAWSPPELQDSSVDPGIRKRAAATAVESAESLTKQALEQSDSGPALVRQFAKENEQRLADGMIDEKQAARVRKDIRKVYGRKLREAARARNDQTLDALGFGDLSDKDRALRLSGQLSDDATVNLILGMGAE